MMGGFIYLLVGAGLTRWKPIIAMVYFTGIKVQFGSLYPRPRGVLQEYPQPGQQNCSFQTSIFIYTQGKGQTKTTTVRFFGPLKAFADSDSAGQGSAKRPAPPVSFFLLTGRGF